MKRRILFIIIPLLAICYSCEESNPTEPNGYDLTDIVGVWGGTMRAPGVVFTGVTLYVDSEGEVSGDYSAKWSIDREGKVTGVGSFADAEASWSLQLDSSKTELMGTLDTPGVHMDVELYKRSSSFLEVSIISPSDSSIVSDTVDISVTVFSSHEITKVEFYIDESLKYTDTSLPYSYSWNTTGYSNGSYTIKAIAYDTTNQTASDQYTVYLNIVKWGFLTGSYVRSSPAIGSDGTIYVGAYDDKLYAINPDGTKKWEFLTGGWVNSSPAIGSDGTIYVGTCDRKLYAINPDGTKKWEFSTGGWVESSPAIGSDGTIYVGSTYPDEKLYAINPDGTKKWDVLSWWCISSSPAIGSDGTIYVGSGVFDSGVFYAINPDGTKKWEFLTSGWVNSSPAIGSDGIIYVGSSSILYAINPDGTKKWKFLTGGSVVSSPAIGSDGTIYVGSHDDKLYAINPDGTKKWEFLTGSNVDSSPAIGSDGTIYVGSNDYKLYAINPDGTKKWEFLTGGHCISCPAIGSDGTIYVGSYDNKLYALNGSGSLADTPWPMFRHDLKHTGRK